MEPEIHVRDRKAVCGSSPVQLVDAPTCGEGGFQCGSAGTWAVIGRKDCQRAIADKLEDVAAVLVNGGNNDIGVVVQQGDDLLGSRVGNPCEAAQVTEPDDRINPVGDAAHDPATQHTLPGVAAEVGLHQ